MNEYKFNLTRIGYEVAEEVHSAFKWGANNGWPVMEEYPHYNRLRELGEQINNEAGFDGMVFVAELVYSDLRGTGYFGGFLDHFWNGVGRYLA